MGVKGKSKEIFYLCLAISTYAKNAVQINGWLFMISKKSDIYETDAWIKKLFEGWFDPCEVSTEEFRAFDGLGSAWKDKTFVNPPYSSPLEWVRQGIKEHKKGKTIAFLLKHDSSTKWYKELHEAGAHFLMIGGRLKHNTGKSANFPSIIAILE